MGNSNIRLPLNCISKCQLVLDGVNEPMIGHHIMNLEGEIDANRLNRAIQSALRAHPTLGSIVRRKYFRLFHEVKEDLIKGALTVKELADVPDANYERCVSEWINKPLDPWKELPFRALLLRKNEVESSLIFTGHHIAVDGLGAALFILKVFDSYGKDVPEESKPPEDIRTPRKGDEIFQFARSQRSSVEHYYKRIISDLLHRFFIAPFHPPTRIFHDKSGRSERLGSCNGSIDPAEFGEIRSKAKAARITVNDVLLAACFRVIDRWNSLHGQDTKSIRIMAPVFIGPKGPKKVVSNQVIWVSVPTMPEDRADPMKLVHKIRADIASMVKNGIPYSLVYFFYFGSRFPLAVMRGICRFFMITQIYVDTTFVSNLGVIWPEEWGDLRVGSAKVASMETVPPVATPMGLALGTYTYSGRLHVCLGYKTGRFSREKAESFLNSYLDEIRNYPL